MAPPVSSPSPATTVPTPTSTSVYRKGFRPSRATSIQIARQLDANYVIVGSFTVTGTTLTAQARVLSHRRSPFFGDPPGQCRSAAPLRRGKLHCLEDRPLRPARFQRGGEHLRGRSRCGCRCPRSRTTSVATMRPFRPSASSASRPPSPMRPTTPPPLLALGKQEYIDRDFASAAATLSKMPPASPLALEGAFYLGLSRFNAANYAGAETAFGFVAGHLPLPEVINNKGCRPKPAGQKLRFSLPTSLLGRPLRRGLPLQSRDQPLSAGSNRPGPHRGANRPQAQAQ